MKSLNDYLEQYRSIASELNITGETSELLINLLSNYSYINEVENISYSRESSLERCTLLNSKIQQCVDRMYSVFRGTCPRIILNFYSQVKLDLKINEPIYTGTNFKLYYSGYYNELNDSWIKENITIAPLGTLKSYKIECILSKSIASFNKTILKGSYYIDFNISDGYLTNDVFITIDNSDDYKVSRLFEDHLLDDKTIFDLTIPGGGSRLYAPNIFINTTNISVNYYKALSLSSINESELKKIKISGTVPVQNSEAYLTEYNQSELADGIILIEGTDPDTLSTIHYKANRNRYATSIIRSNSDAQYLLEECFPNKIRSGSTSIVYKTPDTTKVVENTITDTSAFSSIKNSISKYNLATYTAIASETGDEYVLDNNTYTSWYWVRNDSSISGKSTFSNGLPQLGVIEIPTPTNITNGTLHIVYRSDSDSDVIKTSTYSILPSSTIINSETSGIKINILKGYNNTVEVIEDEESLLGENSNYSINYSLGNGSYIDNTIDDMTFDCSLLLNSNDEFKCSYINLYLLNGSKIIAQERIPIVTSDTGYVLDIAKDTVYIESDSSGKISSEFPITLTNVYLYNGTELVDSDDISYEIVNLNGVTYEIGDDGIIKLTAIDDSINSINIPIIATYNGNTLSRILTIKKTSYIYLEDDMSREFYVGNDKSGNTYISKFGAKNYLEYAEIPFTNTDTLYIWAKDKAIRVYDAYFTYTSSQVINLVDSDSTVLPEMYIYYVPIATNNLLNKSEISEFLKSRGGYFMSNDINIQAASKYKAIFNIGVTAYSSDETPEDKILEIVQEYQYKLNQDIESEMTNITTLINKISSVKIIDSISVSYCQPNGDSIEFSEIDLSQSYFEVSCNINTNTIL